MDTEMMMLGRKSSEACAILLMTCPGDGSDMLAAAGTLHSPRPAIGGQVIDISCIICVVGRESQSLHLIASASKHTTGFLLMVLEKAMLV